jgi:DNA end-binding protein Ku
MRAIWKGSISFGLVNIPIGLYSATRSAHEVSLKMLRASDLSAIRYKRVAEADDQEVPWEEIIKGYEYEKGRYVPITKSDFERVNVRSTQTVDIKEFVNLDEIDPMFFDKPYFLAPEKGGEKAYALLRQALETSNKVGIAKVVIKTREHLAAVKPLGKALVLELMHFADQLLDVSDLKIPGHVELGKKEIAMAESLIEGMTDTWEPARYKDEYTEALLQVIEEKVAAGGKELPPAKKPRAPGKVVDLVAVLQESLDQAKARKKPEKPEKKPAEKKKRAA